MKLLKVMNWVEDAAVFIVCLVLFLGGVYGLVDSYLVYHQANDASILKFKPGYEGTLPDKELKGNVVAWLTVNGTDIDYPVMQGENNQEYLNKSPFGEYSLAGSIFLDYRNASDFSDPYSLIYGHHMENGYMFGALDQFQNEAYFRSHKTGKLVVGDKEYSITFVAVLKALATDQVLFAPDQATKEQISDKTGVRDKGRVLALSTCRYPDTAERTVLVGVLNEK